jgi:hypothetical protein
MREIESDQVVFRSLVVLPLLSASMLALSPSVRADEGGVPFWLSGQFASLAAVPAAPGWSLITTPYYYSGSADRSESSQKGNTVTAGLQTRTALLLFQPGYAFREKILGGQPYVGIGWGPGYNLTSVDATLSPPGISGSRSDSVTGGTDLYPFASLAWNKGDDNWMYYLTGDIPVGAYDSKRLANLGLGHAAIDTGGGYTYLNNTTGREFSTVLGFTYNWENESTNYQSGIDSHLDWAASQFLSANWAVGVVGYVYYQLTGDSGSGNKVGAFESRVASVGPQVGYVFNFNGQQAYANLRAYWEFWAQNRVEGYAIFGTISIPLGSGTK